MKYSYMPTKNYYDKIDIGQTNGAKWFDSDEKIIYFRNQYRELFVLAPYKVQWTTFIIIFIAGFGLGKML